MKQIILFFVAVTVVAVLSSFCTMHWMEDRRAESVDQHEWLHTELNVTAAQKAALAPIEARFAERNRVLRDRMHAANHELAVALSKRRPDAPEIADAIGKIHLQMGQLQKASIEHLFEMRDQLTTEQADKLFQMAQRALDDSP